MARSGTAGDDDADDSDEDEVVDRNILGVLDRAELKKLSSSITVRLSKAQKPKK